MKNIEIYGIHLVNKGAELMLMSIINEINKRYKDTKCVVTCRLSDVFRYDKKIPYYRIFPTLKNTTYLFPNFIKNSLKIADNDSVSVILDASGFAYGDQWGEVPILYFLDLVKKWKRKNKTIILLPQAFGSFNNKKIRNAMIEIIDKVDYIFARDKESYEHFRQITNQLDKISLSPDFTNLLPGKLPKDFNTKNGVAIIPNYRMIDKTDNGELYINLLLNAIKFLIKIEETPFFLIHEGHDDLKLAEQINSLLPIKIPIYYGYNAIELKGILGTSRLVFGSRYHGLVSALSQGVPTIGIGWSHKYKYLFSDYNYDKGLLPISNWDTVQKKLINILDENTYLSDKKILLDSSSRIKLKTKELWQAVFNIIDNK